METLTVYRFKTNRELDPSTLDSIRSSMNLTLLNVGRDPSKPEYYYHVNSNSPETINLYLRDLWVKGLEFVATRTYTLEHKFPIWVPKSQRTS